MRRRRPWRSPWPRRRRSRRRLHRPPRLGVAPAAPAHIAIQSVEASAGGGLVAKGDAPPNATVRLYVDSAFVGDAKTRGRRTLVADDRARHDPRRLCRPRRPNRPGRRQGRRARRGALHHPRADGAGEAGDRRAPSPAAVPSPSDVVVDAVQTHHVERGHTLWGISQKFYGDGSRYAVIFSANSEQILNPNLIYPGQTFVVPKGLPKP